MPVSSSLDSQQLRQAVVSLRPIFLLVKWVGDQWMPVGDRCVEALFTSKEQALDFVRQEIPYADLRLYNVLDMSVILPPPDRTP
jgi:hypothetical protein